MSIATDKSIKVVHVLLCPLGEVSLEAIVPALPRKLCKALYGFCEAESLITTDFKVCWCRFPHSHNIFFIVRIKCLKKDDSIIHF